MKAPPQDEVEVAEAEFAPLYLKIWVINEKSLKIYQREYHKYSAENIHCHVLLTAVDFYLADFRHPRDPVGLYKCAGHLGRHPRVVCKAAEQRKWHFLEAEIAGMRWDDTNFAVVSPKFEGEKQKHRK